ncbi:MAG TPA: UTP--glucose-1-phosphate uridylyltransferase GalU, partial [Aestuariivirgaceae bacterium]|nr:UTP--glucose-1-phosphate uridylyltransferase GalU [Aestuariivirgaceae bacterium]
FPVAGLGTRFLPATKAIPKEMIPVVDRPVIEITVEEAREAGIEHFVFVTGRNKGAIEDHFDKQFELDAMLEARGKTRELEALTAGLPEAGRTSFTRQQEPLGLGHAVWCARDIVGNEPFALILPDMLIKAEPGCLRQMMEVYQSKGGNVIAVEECDPEHVSRYGVVSPAEWFGNAFAIKAMIEKPKREDAPSNLIISGRYILQPEIFAKIAAQGAGAGGEIQVTDAMIALLQEQAFYGVKYTGRTFDCGDKLGFLSANVAYGLDHPEFGADFRQMLKAIIAEHDGL